MKEVRVCVRYGNVRRVEQGGNGEKKKESKGRESQSGCVCACARYTPPFKENVPRVSKIQPYHKTLIGVQDKQEQHLGSWAQ